MGPQRIDRSTREALLQVLRDEYVGESVASALTQTAPTARERESWTVFADLERATALRIEVALDLPAGDYSTSADIAEEVAQHLSIIRSRSWADNMVLMREPFETAVEHVRSVAVVLPANLAQLGEWIVRHEEAWLAFVIAEAAGHADSLGSARRLLAKDGGL